MVSRLYKLTGDLRLLRFLLEHCFEQIRQAIQCSGDLTPVPLRPYGDGHLKTYIGEPEVHTCRNWASFRDWYTERGNNFGKISGHRV